MANEANYRCELNIFKGNLNFRSNPNDFSEDVVVGKGPSPGAVTISTAGTVVNLSELDSPGLVRIINLDDTNFVEFGIYDGSSFWPLGEVLAGRGCLFRFSRNLGNQFGAGTGTVGPIGSFMVKADTAACDVIIEAFES